MPDDSLKLSPAGARKCLSDEKKAARLEAALAAADEATAAANIHKGQASECRAAGVVDRRLADQRLADKLKLEARVEQLEGQRWKIAAAAASSAVVLTLLTLVLLK